MLLCILTAVKREIELTTEVGRSAVFDVACRNLPAARKARKMPLYCKVRFSTAGTRRRVDSRIKALRGQPLVEVSKKAQNLC